MIDFFDIDKLETYKGWLKKIVQYFNYEKIEISELWDFLSNEMSFNEGKWYDLKLSLIFLYGIFFKGGGEYFELDKSTITQKINDLVFEDGEMALSKFLNIPPILFDVLDYHNSPDDNSGSLTISILTDGSEYAVYSEDVIDREYDEWKETYIEDVGIDGLYNIEAYLDFDIDSSIVQDHISEEVYISLNDKTDDEIVEIADMVDEKEDLETKISKLKKDKKDNKIEKFKLINDIKLIDSQIYDLEIKNDEGEYDEKIENLELEKEQIEELIIKIDYDNVQVER